MERCFKYEPSPLYGLLFKFVSEASFRYPRNENLLESCRQEAKEKYLHWDQASNVIIRALWKRLKESHRLRVVE